MRASVPWYVVVLCIAIVLSMTVWVWWDSGLRADSIPAPFYTTADTQAMIEAAPNP